MKKIPVYGWVVAGVLLLVVIYLIVFIVPRQVTYTYSGTSCVPQLTLFPSTQKDNSDRVTVTPKNELKIGNWAYAATEVCVTPDTAFSEGKENVWVSPNKWPLFARQYAVTVGKAPQVNEPLFPEGKKLSTTTPLKVVLDQPDQTYKYTVRVGSEAANCEAQHSELYCDVPALKLNQGARYELTLERSLHSSQEVKKIGTYIVETLTPLVQKSASISPDQVLYNEAKEFSIVFERPVSSAEVTIKDAEEKSVQLDTVVKNDTITIKSAEDLSRKKQFILEVKQAIGEDGSSLAEPIRIPFSTSGGPKVASVSIGTERIAPNARVIVTFDQPVAESVNIQAAVRSTGIASAVQRISPSQIALTLQGGKSCTAFSVEVDKGLKSGSNKEVSEAAWKHSARTICGTSWVIGSSVKGRAIIAHSFGNGSSTVLFTGGIHGSEPSGSATMNGLVSYLQARGHEIPEGRRIVIVPSANPDGLASGSRYNANGVDLARNFPASNWRPDIQTTSGTKVGGGGSAPGSEPEAKALINLTSQLRPRLHVSYHAQGRLVGANQVGDSIALANSYAQTVGYRTMYSNAEAVMGYAITGEFEDWMGEKLGVPAILIELPSHGGNYLNSQTNAIWKMIRS